MENFKTFYEAQTASRLEEIIQPPPDKNFVRLWKKIVFTEIYRKIQTFAFPVLREYTSWAYKNGAVQMFFLALTRNMFAEKCIKCVGFWLWRSILFTMLSELRFVK